MFPKLVHQPFWLFLCVAVLLLNGFSASAQERKKAHKSSRTATANKPPVVQLNTSTTEIRLPANCTPGSFPKPDWQPTSTRVRLVANANDPNGNTLNYRYYASSGQIIGQGPNVVWDLTGVKPGAYRVNVYAFDGVGEEVCDWVTVKIWPGECMACGTVKLSGPQEIVPSGETVQLKVEAQNLTNSALSYQWSATPGRIADGQGSPWARLDTSGLHGQTVNVAVRVNGLDPLCPANANFSFAVAKRPEPTLFDSFYFTNMDDAKARLDTFATQMQQAPDANAVMVVYGGCAGEAMKLAQRQKDYLVNQRGLDANRIQIFDGGCRAQTQTELWSVPNGAPLPAIKPAGACPPCKARR